MEVINKIAPSELQARRFTEPGHDRAIYMLNLLKFKERAEYEDGRETDLSGAEAYALYGKEVAGHLAKVGGTPAFSASVESLRVVPKSPSRNHLACCYPHSLAFLHSRLAGDECVPFATMLPH